jgi:hypothetical protein
MYEGLFDPKYGSSFTPLGIKNYLFLLWLMLGNKLQMSSTQYWKHSIINIYQGGRLLLRMHFGYQKKFQKIVAKKHFHFISFSP